MISLTCIQHLVRPIRFPMFHSFCLILSFQKSYPSHRCSLIAQTSPFYHTARLFGPSQSALWAAQSSFRIKQKIFSIRANSFALSYSLLSVYSRECDSTCVMKGLLNPNHANI